MFGRGQEVQHHVGVGVVPDLRAVGRGQAADDRGQRGRPLRAVRPAANGANSASGAPNGSGRPRSAMNCSAVRMISSELASHSAEVAPQAVMPCPPSTQPIACGLAAAMAAMSNPSWKPGRRQGTQTTRSPKHSAVSCLTVGAGGQRDARVRVQVVDMRLLDQAVHGGVDGRGRTTLAEQAEVERGHHLVLALDARVDAGERAQPIEPEHGQAGRLERAQVAAGALDPEQLGLLAGHRIGRPALGRGVAAGVVGVAGVGAEPVRSGDQLGYRGVLSHDFLLDRVQRPDGPQAPQPACWPPTRSATICSA